METRSITTLFSLLFIIVGIIFMAVVTTFAIPGIFMSILGIILFAAILRSYKPSGMRPVPPARPV